MPIYEYRCRKGHTFEVMQSMSDDPVTACTECRAAVERVYHPVAVHFKGSGFYTTDYGRGRSGAEDSASGGDGDKKDSKETVSGKSESSGDSGSSSKSEKAQSPSEKTPSSSDKAQSSSSESSSSRSSSPDSSSSES